VDGFTGDQRFFIGYAQAWRWKARDAWLDQLLQRNFHPPNDVRPQTVRNIDAWYVAFDGSRATSSTWRRKIAFSPGNGPD
jgi:putative endopeptidase